ncbi:hypothetical protein [Chryseobacterium lathyri]|uniref:Uncharacterized protein n=1 Tax=Chryseobacterium lathyri TaxID=395933 RepID=A0ABT9SQZ5_9FLAO|nr:hypothetical protein [Chryseobacterium lathyri]MDP9961865.1 hypothetical protein [Chryseobacterium lathyri]
MSLLTETDCDQFSFMCSQFQNIMLDFLKFRTFCQKIINALVSSADFETLRSKGNHTTTYQHKKYNIKLECRKSKNTIENEFIFVDIFITPHYYFNGNKHNGNDFTPEDCKQVLTEIFFSILEIEPSEFVKLQLINLEYGININPEVSIRNLIEGILYYKKTPFVFSSSIKTYKITNATSYKQIKAYDKGIQFIDYPQYGIQRNTFRFEIRSKQAKNIRKLGICSLDDLFRDEVYGTLGESLLSEWENILLVNLEPDLTGLNSNEAKYMNEASTVEFWITKLQNPYRNTYAREIKKYYHKSQNRNNLHHQLRVQILDKIFHLLSGANSIQGMPMKSGFKKNEKIPSD